MKEWIGRGVSWVTLVLVVFVDVVMHYLFNTSLVFNQELKRNLFAFIFLIGAGYTLLHDGHVRVGIIEKRGPARNIGRLSSSTSSTPHPTQTTI